MHTWESADLTSSLPCLETPPVTARVLNSGSWVFGKRCSEHLPNHQYHACSLSWSWMTESQTTPVSNSLISPVASTQDSAERFLYRRRRCPSAVTWFRHTTLLGCSLADIVEQFRTRTFLSFCICPCRLHVCCWCAIPSDLEIGCFLFEVEGLLKEILFTWGFFSHPRGGFQFLDLLPNMLAQFTLFGKINSQLSLWRSN